MYCVGAYFSEWVTLYYYYWLIYYYYRYNVIIAINLLLLLLLLLYCVHIGWVKEGAVGTAQGTAQVTTKEDVRACMTGPTHAAPLRLPLPISGVLVGCAQHSTAPQQSTNSEEVHSSMGFSWRPRVKNNHREANYQLLV